MGQWISLSPSCRKYPGFRPVITRARFKGHSAFLSDWRDVPCFLPPFAPYRADKVANPVAGRRDSISFSLLFQKAKLFLNWGKESLYQFPSLKEPAHILSCTGIISKRKRNWKEGGSTCSWLSLKHPCIALTLPDNRLISFKLLKLHSQLSALLYFRSGS